MSSVFHYTDTGGLRGIIATKSLYATDYRYSNDATEGGSIHHHILPIFEAEMAEITEKLVKRGFLDQEFYDELGRRGSQLEAQANYNAFTQSVDNVSPFFVVSFCRHEEHKYERQNGLLSQWRGYADGGGFAIEIDEEVLDKLSRLEQQGFEYAGFRSDDVNYFDHEKSFDVNDFKGVAGEITRGIFNKVGKNVQEITGTKDLGDAILSYAKSAPFLKHQSFHEEKEYRIVFVCYRASKVKGAARPIKKVKFRQKDGLLIPYIELFRFNDEGLTSAIKGIIVGPHAFQDKQEEALKMLLESEGLKIDVRKSETPYRG